MSAPLISTDWHPERAREETLRRLLGYWRAKRCGRAMPDRGDIDPAEMGRMLPHVFLVDVKEAPRDYRFRLAGTHISDFVGMEMRSKTLSEVFPPDLAAEVRAHWDAAIDRPAPILCRGRLWVAERVPLPWEGIIMPLSVPARRGVAMLLGGLVFAARGA